MNITKDEARILAVALENGKYEINDKQIPNLFEKLEELEAKLFLFSGDLRRTGRESQNFFSDCLKRFANFKKQVRN